MRVLTPEQEAAVARRREPLLLAAGAGSGKTSVLVERFVRAVGDDGIAPARILAITFTERAAGELRARVRERLLGLGERAAAHDMEGAPIGTFHGFCARLLRAHPRQVGLDPDFAILDEPEAARLRLLAFRHALGELLGTAGPAALPAGAQLGRSSERRPGHGPSHSELAPAQQRHAAIDLLAAYGADRVRTIVLGAYAEQRSLGAELPRLPDARARGAADVGEQAERHDIRAVRACALLGQILQVFGLRYGELKQARAALDFDDLELLAVRLLVESRGVRAAWSERLELLMVDEFQDTNARQLRLLELLERENLFTVGDELQSIYGFRHADVEIFRTRRRTLRERGAALALACNFRARPVLVNAVNAVFGERFGDAHMPLLATRPAAAQTPPVELLLTDRRGWAQAPDAQEIAAGLPPAPLWRQAEARLLARRVAELLAVESIAPRQVAILLRARSDLPVYERALQSQGLRTLAAVGSFWGDQQVGDLLAWLRALANPLDELALYSTLASPLVGVGSDALALLALHARARGTSTWVALRDADAELHARLPPRDGERLQRFAADFAAERRCAPSHPLAALLLRAIAAGDYERHIGGLSWGERRLANVHKLLRLARRYEATEGRDLRGFLDHAAHREALAAGGEPAAPTDGGELDAVCLMTIHAAKGLEFDVVCVADLGRGPGSGEPDLLVDGARVGLRLASLDGSPVRPCLDYEELVAERRRAEAAEEDRVLYVAMTRARERLLLSGAVDFERWPVDKPGCAPIAWLAPALVPDVVKRALAARRAESAGQPQVEHSTDPVPTRCWLHVPSAVDARCVNHMGADVDADRNDHASSDREQPTRLCS